MGMAGICAISEPVFELLGEAFGVIQEAGRIQINQCPAGGRVEEGGLVWCGGGKLLGEGWLNFPGFLHCNTIKIPIHPVAPHCKLLTLSHLLL